MFFGNFCFLVGMSLFGEKLIIILLVRSRALLWHEVCSCRLALSLGVIIIIIFYFAGTVESPTVARGLLVSSSSLPRCDKK